ncbi:MAG: WYL domain-containing protein [Candidatus Omnitrophota bacterium]
MVDNKIIDQLTELAVKHHVVSLVYQKSLSDLTPSPRLIEPYSLSQGKQDIMLRAYQLAPEEGWRFFMLHKIIGISDNGTSFKPRKKVTIQTGEITPTFHPYESWTDAVQKYRNMVLSFLSDRVITEGEKKKLQKFVEEENLQISEIRGVHLSIFSECLQHVLRDGIVDDGEAREIELLNNCLTSCGYGINSAR